MTQRRAENVIAAIASSPWSITAEGLETIIAIARRENDADAIASRMGKRAEGSRHMSVRDEIATIAVHGPLFRYANLFTEMSGATSLEQLSAEIGQALNDSAIRGILFDVDSPGGQVNGTSELGAMIYGARGRKPMKAVVSGIGASGAYWIASAADEVIAVDTAMLGSIGVVLSLWRGDDDDDDVIEIVSSQSPKKRLDLNNDDDRAELQSLVDGLADVFVSTVARNRGVSVEHVLENFGRGGIMVGRTAVAAGLANRVGTLETVHAELAAGLGSRGSATADGIPPRAPGDAGRILALHQATAAPAVAGTPTAAASRILAAHRTARPR